jgi:hypothetical protein
MRRIELLVAGSLDKEAAKRNGGLVLPEKHAAALERGTSVGWSMACKVAEDACVICHNKAANRSEYCTEDTCVDPDTGMHGHGCKSGLTKLCSDGRMQGVDNPDPYFFDISIVGRPAERMAYGWKADYVKQASAYTIGGAELAEQYGMNTDYDFALLPLDQAERRPDIQLKVARELSAVAAAQFNNDYITAIRLGTQVCPIGTNCIDTTKQAAAVSALATAGVVLPLRDFLIAFCDQSPEQATKVANIVRPAINDAFINLPQTDGVITRLATNEYMPRYADAPSANQRYAAIKLASSHSVASADELRKRAAMAVMRGTQLPVYEKSASQVTDVSRAIAQQYALYAVASVAAMPDNFRNNDLTYRTVVLQNN